MRMFKWLFPEKPVPLPPLPARREGEKVDFHVQRFTRALEQCTNEAKRSELERYLRYWTAIKAAQEGLN